METKPLAVDAEIERALQLALSANSDPEELKQARQRGDELRRQMRAKYGDRSIAVQLIREIRDGE